MKIIEQTELSADQKSRIVDLWNAEYPIALAFTRNERFDQYLNGLENKKHFLLTNQTNLIVGWALTFDRESERWFAIIVERTTQGSGHGTKLINRLRESEERLFGWVIDHNKSKKLNGDQYISPIGFYKKIGFTIHKDERIDSGKMSGVKVEWNRLDSVQTISFSIRKLDPDEFELAQKLFLLFQIDDGVEVPTFAGDGYLKEMLGREDFHVIAAIEDDQIIGGLTAYELKKYKTAGAEMFLYEIAVEAAHRRRGVAANLIAQLKEICAQKGISEMFVATEIDNVPARNLYQATDGDIEEAAIFSFKIN